MSYTRTYYCRGIVERWSARKGRFAPVEVWSENDRDGNGLCPAQPKPEIRRQARSMGFKAVFVRS